MLRGTAIVIILAPMKADWHIFIGEYLADRNATRAYGVAYPGVTAVTAAANGYKLLRNAEIADEIAARLAVVADAANVRAEDVLRKLWAVATANPNDLIEISRDACRHCYGTDGEYQYTPAEWRRVAADQVDGDGVIPDPPDGWYNKLMPPMPGCPECFGEGVESVTVKDTRHLSPEALELFAGVKVTSKGIEILTHNRDKNLELIGRHLAMFTDRIDSSSSDGSMSPMTLDEFYGANAKPGTP